jgi:D-alanine-D-alanine ligase
LDNDDFLNNPKDPDTVSLKLTKNKLAVGFGDKKLIDLTGEKEIPNPKVVFPVLHGTFGEDGTMQGLLDIMDVAYVGPDVLGSSVAMDKDTAKNLFIQAGILTAPFELLTSPDDGDYSNLAEKFGVPFFLKPPNCGSSVGVHKVKNEEEFKAAIKDAFQFDKEVIVEQYIPGREIECSVLGNEELIASLPGEIIPKHEFYSYEAKYIDPDGAGLEVPAKLDDATIKNVQETAKKVFKTLSLEGMARIDFFLSDNGDLYVNEANTIPGFTNISMYPKLLGVTGIGYEELLDRLINLGIERYNRKKSLKFSY